MLKELEEGVYQAREDVVDLIEWCARADVGAKMECAVSMSVRGGLGQSGRGRHARCTQGCCKLSAERLAVYRLPSVRKKGMRCDVQEGYPNKLIDRRQPARHPTVCGARISFRHLQAAQCQAHCLLLSRPVRKSFNQISLCQSDT